VDLVFRPGRIGAPVRMTTLPAVTPLVFSNRTETVPARTNAGISLYRPIGENLVHVSGRLGTNGTSVSDSVSVHQPARWFLTLLREALNKRGVKVEGELRVVNWLDRQVTPLDQKSLLELGSVESPPLGEIVRHMMKPSQNLYAQLLLLQVGKHAETARHASMSTEDVGLLELQKFLAEAGVRKGEALLEEGSGLSRGALVTPHATITLLRYMDKHRHAGVFRDSLPIAGVDGTLKNRLKNTAATGNLRAKTGTLRYVNTLSGYVTNRSGERLVFSIMLNNYGAAGGGRAEVDALGEMLAESVTR
jgi:serine-type D-Ala-D-Ala carboxypeptidase/endopeptidase (penicillin-binding protein 4)